LPRLPGTCAREAPRPKLQVSECLSLQHHFLAGAVVAGSEPHEVNAGRESAAALVVAGTTVLLARPASSAAASTQGHPTRPPRPPQTGDFPHSLDVVQLRAMGREEIEPQNVPAASSVSEDLVSTTCENR
jgi:hypothetical protein